MTCIVAYKDIDRIFMGGDDIAAYSDSASYDKRSYTHSKVFSKTLKNKVSIKHPNSNSRTVLIGYTTSFRMGQILEYNFELPEFDPETISSNMEYMVKFFIPALYNLFDEHLYIKKSDAGEASGGEFIVAFEDNIFTISDDFSVMEFEEPYTCVGCGESYALGALHVASKHMSTNSIDVPNGENIVRAALKAAAKFSGFVGDKTNIIST